MLAAMVRQGSSRGSWNPTAERASNGATTLPSIATTPSEGRSRPPARSSRSSGRAGVEGCDHAAVDRHDTIGGLVTHDVDEALQLADRVILLGNDGDQPGARIQQTVVVPGTRPRDRGSAELAELRGRLLDGLGIDRHGAARGVPTTTTIPHYPY